MYDTLGRNSCPLGLLRDNLPLLIKHGEPERALALCASRFPDVQPWNVLAALNDPVAGRKVRVKRGSKPDAQAIV